jgi:ribonuclease D
MMKFNPKITKEEVNQLETAEFPGKIVLVDQKSKIKSAVEFLKTQKIVGIDTETRPSFTRGTNHKVSLMQISTDDICYLFRLNKIGFPIELLDFLSNTEIKKIGLSLRDDFYSLNKRQKTNPNNFIDIQNIAKDYGILELGL